MEQHPIPQNVTTFEFKLIGDMTVRQFIYLAAGVLVGYIFYSLRWPAVIRFPLAFFSGFTGFAFAFMPIEERPLDRWFVNFIKSVYSPTQFLWKKAPKIPGFWEQVIPSYRPTTTLPFMEMRQKLDVYLKSLPQEPKSTLDELEFSRLTALNLGGETPLPKITPYVPPYPFEVSGVKVHRLHTVDITKEGIIFPVGEKTILPAPITPPSEKSATVLFEAQTPITGTGLSVGPGGIITKIGTKPLDERPAAKITPQAIIKPKKETVKTDLLEQNEKLKKQVEELQSQLSRLKTEPIPETMTAAQFDDKIRELVNKMTETEKERQKSEKELVNLRRQLSEKQQIEQPVIKPELEIYKETRKQPTAKYIAGKLAQQKGIPNLPTTPNIVNGIVTALTGEILSGVIVIVKDKNDTPVRALKTNKLGQFMISTPLENGIYRLELEKVGFQFDIIEVELNGGILPPIEIKAK